MALDRGSYSKEGETWDLHETKDFYYEPDDDHEKYKQLQKVRARVDPHGIFTPNVFCVKADANPTAAPTRAKPRL